MEKLLGQVTLGTKDQDHITLKFKMMVTPVYMTIMELLYGLQTLGNKAFN